MVNIGGVDIDIGGPGAGFPRPSIEDARASWEFTRDIINNFGKIEIADVFIFIGLGLIFGNQIAGITDKISQLIRSQP